MRKTGIKWLLIISLILILVFTFAACSSKKKTPAPVDEPIVVPDEPDEVVYKDPVLAIISADAEDPYESSIINAAKLVCMTAEVPISTTVATPENAVDVITTLKNNEANVIISTTTSLENNLVDAARLLPDIQFITIGGTRANNLKLSNYHNAYASIQEGRYLNGIVAGLKLNQLIANDTISEDGARIGFIATDPVQEQISAYTAFYLGAKSVCPTVKMSVKFAKTDAAIGEATSLLITIGCKVISQYSYQDEIVTRLCSENEDPIFNVTYLTDNKTKYSNSFLTGFNINWTPYFTYLINTLKNKSSIATDWSGTLSNGAIEVLDINTSIVPSNAVTAVEEATTKLRNKTLQIFDTSSFTVEKCPVISYVPAINTTRDAYIQNDTSSYIIDSNATLFRSVPYFGLLIDGIYYDSNVTIQSIGQYNIDISQLPDEDDNLSPAEKYFKALLQGAKAVDIPDIDPTTDKISYTISGYIEYASDIANSITRAYEINIILDLAAINAEVNPSFGDSAIRVRLYNKNNNANFFTILYFTKDTSDTIFMQYKDQYFKFGLGSSFDINDVVANIRSISENEETASTIETITNRVSRFIQSGSTNDASFATTTLKSLFLLFDINIDEYLASPAVLTMLGSVGLTLEDLQTITVQDLLIRFGDYIIDKDQVVIKENLDDSISYESKDFSKQLKTIVNQFANNILAYISFGLSFTISEDNTFKDITFDFYSSYTNYQHFDIRVHVNEITANIITANAKDLLGNTNEYKDYLEFNLSASLDLKNKIAIYVEDTPVTLGKFDLNAYLALDFINEGASNKTSIEITLESDNSQILRIVFKDGTLCIDVDMSNAQMQAIANAFLEDICELIKEYTIGSKANVAFKLIGDAADELLSKVFDSVGNINTSFSNITINDIDLFTISRGLLYGIANNVLIGINSELPIVERDEPTTTSLAIYDGEENTSLLSYNVSLSSNNLIRLISSSISYDETNSIISISLSDIKSTLASLYSAGRDKPKTTSEIMAYFIGTNDYIINDLTIHGLWPLYNGNLNTQKYITNEYTIEMAVADGYSSMPGSVLSKTNAENIWKFISKQESTLNYLYILRNTSGAYIAVNDDYTTLDEYLDSFAVNRYFNLFKASTILNGATNVNTALNNIFNSSNSITIQFAENEDMLNVSLVALGQTFTLNVDFDLVAVDLDDIVVPTFTNTSTIADGNKLIISLDEDFYTLFEAVFGMGYGTSIASENATNNSLFYIAETATYDSEEEQYTAIELSGNAIIILDATNYRLVTTTEDIDGTYVIDEENNTFTSITLNGVADGTAYDILGSRYKVLIEK